jgi:hypothetical protein
MDRIYLCGAAQTETQQALNQELADFLQSFGFPVILAQTLQDQAAVEEAISQSKLLVAILHNRCVDPETARCVETAHRREIPVLGFDTTLDDPACQGLGYPVLAENDPLAACLVRRLDVPQDPDDWMNPLISMVNLHY